MYRFLSVLLTLVIGCGALVMGMLPVQAGSWAFTLEGSGSKSTSSPFPGTGWLNGSWNQTFGPPPRPGVIYTSDGAGPTSSAPTPTSNTQGKATLVCTWTPSFVNDPLPTTLCVDVTSTATADGLYPPGASSSGISLNVDNGLGTNTVYQNTAPYTDYMGVHYGVYKATATGSVIKQAQTSGQAVVRISLANVSASASGISGVGVGGPVDVNATFSAQVDNRSVILTRSGSVGDTSSVDTLGRWTTTGDTTYSYYKLQSNGYPDYSTVKWNWQTIVANIQAAGHKIVNVQWGTQSLMVGPAFAYLTAPPIPDTPTSVTRAISSSQYEYGYSPLWDNGPGGMAGNNYVCTVTFDDGAQASATYQFVAHSDYEDNSVGLVGHAPEQANLRRHPYAIDAVSPADGSSLTAGVSQDYSWTVQNQFLGSGDSYQAARWMVQPRTTLYADQKLVNLAPANLTVSAFNVPKGQGIYLQIYDNVNHQWGTALHYNPNGYVGQTPFEFYAPWVALDGSQQLWGATSAYLH